MSKEQSLWDLRGAENRERRLGFMADVLENWLTFTRGQCEKEGIEMLPDRHIISPPVWPTVYTVQQWINTIRDDGWISIDDDHPEHGEKVIASYPGVYDYRLVTYWYDGNHHFGTPNEPDGKGSQPALYWRRIPEPKYEKFAEALTETIMGAGND